MPAPETRRNLFPWPVKAFTRYQANGKLYFVRYDRIQGSWTGSLKNETIFGLTEKSEPKYHKKQASKADFA
jgi:hypothetical protein